MDLSKTISDAKQEIARLERFVEECNKLQSPITVKTTKTEISVADRPVNKGRIWSKSEIAKVKQLWSQGKTDDEIGQQLGRTNFSVGFVRSAKGFVRHPRKANYNSNAQVH